MTLVAGPNHLDGSTALSRLPHPPDRFLAPDEIIPIDDIYAPALLEAERERANEFAARGIPVITKSNARQYAEAGFVSPTGYRELALDPSESAVGDLLAVFPLGSVAVGGLDEDGNYLNPVPGVRQFSVRIQNATGEVG